MQVTMQQGDTDSRQGIYHINAAGTVTQWQIVGCCETISEAYLEPVLEAILHQFSFRIRGFHCDNGAEFLNRRVEKLWNKMLVSEFTKSRAHRTTDNALGAPYPTLPSTTTSTRFGPLLVRAEAKAGAT